MILVGPFEIVLKHNFGAAKMQIGQRTRSRSDKRNVTAEADAATPPSGGEANNTTQVMACSLPAV